MKSFKLIPVGAALALFVAASSAYAVTVSPAGAISLEGATTLIKSSIPLGCTTNMVGNITSTGAITITSAKFSGQALCSAITAAGLPWTGQVNTTKSLSLNGVAVDTPLGHCGPSAIKAGITENAAQRETTIGFANQVLSGSCSVTGTLATTPVLTVH
jgi:hypothetical protein